MIDGLRRALIPTVARVAYLTNPDNRGTLEVLTEMKLAAPTAGMALIGVEFVYPHCSAQTS